MSFPGTELASHFLADDCLLARQRRMLLGVADELVDRPRRGVLEGHRLCERPGLHVVLSTTEARGTVPISQGLHLQDGCDPNRSQPASCGALPAHASRSPRSLQRSRQPDDHPTVITTHGVMSRKTCRVSILAHGNSVGSWPGCTRSTVTPPCLGPNTLGATSTTPEKAVGSQIAPTLFGAWP